MEDWSEKFPDQSLFQRIIKTIYRFSDHCGTTKDIAAHLKLPYDEVNDALNRFHELGELEKIHVEGDVYWFVNTESNDYLRGFGMFASTTIPEEMRLERERARESWSDHEAMSR